MKYMILTCMAALAMLPCGAVQTAENYEASKAYVQDDGYILFAYAEDWDTFSERICSKLMASEAVKKAANQAVFMRVPIPNVLTEERKAADKERFGPLQVADAPDYPAILMLDKNGRHYSTITGPFMHKVSSKKVAEMITKRMAAQKEQAALMEKAKNAKGVEKARLLGEATLIPDINPPEKRGQIINQIKKLDPKDESGYIRKLRDPMDFVGEIVGIEKSKDADKGWEVALKKVKEYLKDPIYAPNQQQALHALAIGLLHRHGGPRAAAEMRSHAKAMEILDANSYLGKSATLAEREWAVGFNLADGWNPSIVSEGDPIELQGPLPFTSPGTYSITFNYERGNHACLVGAVSLYDGENLVVEDRHKGSAGRKSQNHVYKLKVDSVLKEPHLYIEFENKGNTNTFGHIAITRE